MVTAPDGVRLFVEDQGTGRPVVLLPGLGDAGWVWRLQRVAVGQVARAIVVDSRGLGRSDRPPAPYSIGRMAQDVAAVVVDAGGGPAVVVGASMGGFVAATLAVLRPDLVRGLVLVATSVGGPGSVPVPDDVRAAWLAASVRSPEEFVRATMQRSFSADWPTEHRERYEELVAARLESATPMESWRVQYDACEAFLSVGLPPGDVEVPTWVVHGLHDAVIPFENAEVTRRRIPHAELVDLNAGHLCWFERPHLVNRLLVEAAETR
jgi:pimeloyl-ACP methyl ester carboxylesterase